jgi:hypothetical protein
MYCYVAIRPFVFTATTRTDFNRIVTTKDFNQFFCKKDNILIFSLEYSILSYNYTKYKKEEMSFYRNYIHIYMFYDKFHMATCFDSQWVIIRPFELIGLTNSYDTWNVGSLRDPMRLYNGYTYKTYFKIKAIW